jgi:hypothetical protein
VRAAFAVGCDGGRSLVRGVASISREESEPVGKNLSVSLYFPDAFTQLGIQPNANYMVFNEDMNTLFCPYNAQEWGYAIGPVPMDFDFGTLDLAEETRRRIGRDAVFTVLWSSDYAGDQAAVAARRQLGRDLYAITYQEWNTIGIVLDQRYDSSAVIVEDGSTAPDWDATRYLPLARPGHRAPHVALPSGRALYDMLGLEFTLLDLGAKTSDVEAMTKAAAAAGVPALVLRLDSPEIGAVYGQLLVLIRPDQHVAWRGPSAPPDPGKVFDTVRGAVADRPLGGPASLSCRLSRS